MNKKLEQFLHSIYNKKVAVMGLGINNLELVKFLNKHGAVVSVFDKSDRTKLQHNIEKLINLNITYFLGEDYLKNLKGFDYIFRTPGMRPDLPEIENEVSKGAILTSEMEIFLEVCPAKIIGITGSLGKTTTTTIIYSILKEEGYICHLGGNIGSPLLWKIDKIEEDHIVILELSSFQLMTLKKSPDISVIINISPNHLDVHKNYDEYGQSKRNMAKYMKNGSILVINQDCKDLTDLLKNEINNKNLNVRFFSLTQNTKYIYIKNKKIYKNEKFLMEISDIKIPGIHNAENYMAAIAAIGDFVSDEAIIKTAKTFGGVEHRTEFVRELDKIRYYNDSKATSPLSTIACLSSFDKKVILICGGKEKGIPFDQLGDIIVEKVKNLVLVGTTSNQIIEAYLKALEKNKNAEKIPYAIYDDFKAAVTGAKNAAEPGDTVILSPASTSYDMFRNFEERGNYFKSIVNGF